MAWHSSLAPRDCRFFFFCCEPPGDELREQMSLRTFALLPEEKKKIGREIHDLKRKKKMVMWFEVG